LVGKNYTEAELTRYLVEEWLQIPLDVIRKTIETVPMRLLEVILRRGQRINY